MDPKFFLAQATYGPCIRQFLGLRVLLAKFAFVHYGLLELLKLADRYHLLLLVRHDEVRVILEPPIAYREEVSPWPPDLGFSHSAAVGQIAFR